jgi:hypothetical protein
MDEELTDTQKYSNYCRLLETIQFIESGGRITEDWMEHHKDVIHEYHNAFPDSFRELNQEIKDREFRTLAEQADVLMNSLLTTIRYERTFKVGHYHLLLQRLQRMLEIVIDYYDEGDELSAFMKNMSLG